ncbi:MAG: hypothetical protein J1E34_00290 [Oscillospiraceae bacterium]|nr:hypothetical protein [Oscillospiraceae bacterium]
MKVILFMAIFWSIYGILGLFGIQVIPQNLRKKPGQKDISAAAEHRGCSWESRG